MNLSSVALPPVDEKTATIFMALELSKSTWLVALHSPAVDKISLHRLQGGDTEGLMALIEHRREQAQAALTRPVRVMSCYEAGYDGFWLHRFLCDRGIDNQVLDAASILVDRRSRRAKTDRLDAAAAAHADGDGTWRAEGLPGCASAEPRAGERSPSQPGTGSARQRTRPAFEPRQGAFDDPGHPRLQASQTGLA
ncbi:hypothetical protein [Mesorhizobium sp. M0060]|uniref:hypothetical protein n=1 Tax=Mesorhizobium sp. M0060 TaxID=2956866 RepID=UPI00333C3D90